MKTKKMIEAYGVKGMKSTPWRKSFRDADHLNQWTERNDAEVHGVRDLEPENQLKNAMRRAVRALNGDGVAY